MQEKLGLGEISCEGFFVEFSVPLLEEWIWFGCRVIAEVGGNVEEEEK